jgi:hypothetical protein
MLYPKHELRDITVKLFTEGMFRTRPMLTVHHLTISDQTLDTIKDSIRKE